MTTLWDYQNNFSIGQWTREFTYSLEWSKKTGLANDSLEKICNQLMTSTAYNEESKQRIKQAYQILTTGVKNEDGKAS